jgi:hypothetical protein
MHRDRSFGHEMSQRSFLDSRFYWLLAAILVVFGFLAIPSIGLPFLTLGITLLVLGRWRGQPRTFWPPLVGFLSFFVGFVLIAPVSCSTTATASGDLGAFTTCSNILGLNYSGGGSYNPPLWPALAVGLVTAAAGTAATRLVLRGQRS